MTSLSLSLSHWVTLDHGFESPSPRQFVVFESPSPKFQLHYRHVHDFYYLFPSKNSIQRLFLTLSKRSAVKQRCNAILLLTNRQILCLCLPPRRRHLAKKARVTRVTLAPAVAQWRGSWFDYHCRSCVEVWGIFLIPCAASVHPAVMGTWWNENWLCAWYKAAALVCRRAAFSPGRWERTRVSSNIRGCNCKVRWTLRGKSGL